MTDFESRLRDSLHDRAEDAPGATGLADGARRRLRRRRTTIAGAGVLAGLVVVAPFLFMDGEPEGPGIATDPTSPSASTTVVDDGVRTESWHDVTFEVPDDWGHGGTSAWCVPGRSPEESTPTVGRPTDIVPMILCDPGQGYGVTIGSAAAFDPVYESGHVWQYDTEGVDSAVYPDGAWLSYWYDDTSVVTIVTPDRALTEQVLGSVHRIDGVDPNGCAPTLGEAEAGLSDGTDSTSLCRYDEGDGLDWSRRLTADEARQLGDAVQAAPMRTEASQCQSQDTIPGRTALLTGGSYTATVITDASCKADNGVFLSGVVRELTDEIRLLVDRPQ